MRPGSVVAVSMLLVLLGIVCISVLLAPSQPAVQDNSASTTVGTSSATGSGTGHREQGWVQSSLAPVGAAGTRPAVEVAYIRARWSRAPTVFLAVFSTRPRGPTTPEELVRHAVGNGSRIPQGSIVAVVVALPVNSSCDAYYVNPHLRGSVVEVNVGRIPISEAESCRPVEGEALLALIYLNRLSPGTYMVRLVGQAGGSSTATLTFSYG